MNTEYTVEDIDRAKLWYGEHMSHVDRLVKRCNESFPMSGFIISRPELWRAEGWNYFFRNYYFFPPSWIYLTGMVPTD